MNTSGGALAFDAIINDVNFRSQLDVMERRVLGFADTTVRETSKVDQSFKRLGQLAAGYFSFNALTQLPAQILKVRGEFQQLEIAFSTMLRSKSKADALLGSLAETAATTPFGLKDIATGAKQLLAYGSTTTNVVKEIRMLGDVASGVSAPINELIYLYGTLRTQGRAYAVDIRQFAGRGIPIYQELAKVLGVNVDKVNEFVEGGKVGFKEVEQAFKNMTSSGGLFAGLMDAQSKSLLGLKERLSDAWDLMLNEIGKKNEGIATELLTTANDVIANYQKVIDILKVAALTYGTYRAAILLVSVAQRAQLVLLQSVALEQGLAAAAGEVLTTQQARQIVVSKLLQRAQASLNATMLANPYVLVGTALAALVSTYLIFRDEVENVKSAQQIMAESAKDIATSFKQQGSEVRTLIGVLGNQNVAESERIKAYDKLNSISPSILQGLDYQKAKTSDLTKTLNEYLVSLEKKIRLESASAGLKSALEQDADAAERLKKAQDDLIKRNQDASKTPTLTTGPDARAAGAGAQFDLNQAKKDLDQAVAAKRATEKTVADIEKSITGIYTGGSKDAINAEIGRLEQVQSSIKDKLSPAYKQVEENLKRLTTQRDALTKAEAGGQKAQARTVEYYDTQIKKLKEQQSQSATSRADFAKYQTQIDSLEKQRRKITGEMTAAEKKAVKDADKIGPYGSISYWESIGKKAQEIIDKTPSGQTGVLAKQNEIKLDAERRVEEIRKRLAVKSFEEELDDKKQKYILYQKWADAYGKQAADVQFKELVAGGQSFVDYLNTQIAQLESQKVNVGLTDKEAGNLSSLLDNRNEFTGKKTAIEEFRDGLQKAGQEARNLTDYLDVLYQKQSELNPNDNSQAGFDKRRELFEQIGQTERDLQVQLRQFLASYASSGEQQLAIQKEFIDKRKALDKAYNTNRGADYQKALGIINRAEKDALTDLQRRQVEESDAYRQTTKVIVEEGRKRLRIQIENQRGLVREALRVSGANSEVYKQELVKLNELTKQYSDGTIGLITQYAAVVGQFGDALTELGGDAANAGALLSGLASNFGLVSAAFKKGIDTSEQVQIGIQAAVQLFSIITSAAAQRKKAETDYYTAIIAQQQQYNLLLNEQIGLRAQGQENVFVKDYVGQLQDGFAKYDDAQKKYQESLKKLSEGQAKIGLDKVVDWSAVGKGAASGAAIGAIAGPIGAAVGGVVGGIIGLFGGKKNAEEFGSLLGRYPELIKKSKDGVDELNTELAQTLIQQGLVDDQTKVLLQSTIDWQKQIEEAQAAIKSIISDLAGALGDKLRDNLVNAFRDGTDAALAFKDAVGGILEDLVTKMLFSQAFNQLFTKLQDDLKTSLDVNGGGDGNTIDDFTRFTENSKDALAQYNLWLQQFQDAAKASGFDVLKPTGGASGTKNPNSIGQAIQGVTESTANVLTGQINAIRITQADTNSVIRQQLLALSGIESNTARIQRTNELLDSVDRRLKTISENPTRGLGQPG